MIEITSWKSAGDVTYQLRPLIGAQDQGNYNWSCNLPERNVEDPLALDLLEIGKALHLADRAFRRSLRLGQRTRRIRVRIPVLRPDVWRRASPILEDLARYASADDWKIEFYKAPTPKLSRSQKEKKPAASVVALFSGGLDSLCGAAYLASKKGTPVFVTHSPPGREATIALIKKVWRAFGRNDFTENQCYSIRLEVREHDQKGLRSMFPEPTRRTRPIYFLCLACAIAIDRDIHEIQMSENGALALSLPIRADAYGALCARQAHAYLLQGLSDLLNFVAPHPSGWKVFNPLHEMTKGEACNQLGKAAPLARNTHSCEYVGRQAAVLRSWKQKHPKLAAKIGKGPQCGICIPCLVRRSALHKAGIRDPNKDYFFQARDVVKMESSITGNGAARPPLYDAAAPHVFYMRRFCEQISRLDAFSFAVQYLPELRLPYDRSLRSEKELKASYELMKRFAEEVSQFLDSR